MVKGVDLRSTGVNSAWVRTPQLTFLTRVRDCPGARFSHQAPRQNVSKVTPVGFEPTQLALVELESTPLDHSGKVSCCIEAFGLFGAMLEAG